MALRVRLDCWTRAMILLTGFVLIATRATRGMTKQEQEEYLRQFAYLDERNPVSREQELNGDRERHFQLAVMRFQRSVGLNVTGIVDKTTVRMMRMPRCGVPDIPSAQGGGVVHRRKRYVTAGDKWDKLHLTYRFLSYTPDLPRNTVREVIRRAFQMWSDVSALTFEETTSFSDIEISFAAASHGDGMPFDGPGNSLAHSFHPGTGIGGDLHFDEDETWTVDSNSGTNLLQVAVHKLGHSLGLGHSDVKDAVMSRFNYREYNPDFALHQDDIDAIRHLYGANPHQISDTDDNGGDVNTNISPRPSAHDEAAAAAVSDMALIVGEVVGALVVIIICVTVVVACRYYRKRKANPQTRKEVAVTDSRNKLSASVAISSRNPAYDIPELADEVYDFVDDTDYDKPDFYEPLAADNSQVACPGNDYDLGPDYLRLVADDPDDNPPQVESHRCDEHLPDYLHIIG